MTSTADCESLGRKMHGLAEELFPTGYSTEWPLNFRIAIPIVFLGFEGHADHATALDDRCYGMAGFMIGGKFGFEVHVQRIREGTLTEEVQQDEKAGSRRGNGSNESWAGAFVVRLR